MGAVVFGIGLIFVGVIFFIAAFAQSMQNRSYAACSEKTSAKVTHKTRRRSKHGTSYELYVEYEVDGNEYKKWIGIDVDTYERIMEGDRFEICYKPQNPKRAVNPANLNPKNIRTILIIAAALSVVGAALLIIGRV